MVKIVKNPRIRGKKKINIEHFANVWMLITNSVHALPPVPLPVAPIVSFFTGVSVYRCERCIGIYWWEKRFADNPQRYETHNKINKL